MKEFLLACTSTILALLNWHKENRNKGGSIEKNEMAEFNGKLGTVVSLGQRMSLTM